MPGLCGLVAANQRDIEPALRFMQQTLHYGRASVLESYAQAGVGLSCVHWGIAGQQAMYRSVHAMVALFGYLTRPTLLPGMDTSDPAAAAHYIHDQYLERGQRFVEQIAGTFALAIWDYRTQSLLLVSDRLGLRPIYYAMHDGLFRYASEVKALLGPGFPHRLDLAAVADFFQESYIKGDRTFFEDIRLLPPASVLCYQDEHWTINNYWEVVYPQSYQRHPDEWYDDLIYGAFQAATKRMVSPAVRYGLSLSGGLDSRWIAGCLVQERPDSLAFTLGVPGSDDLPLAQEVARRTGFQHYCWDVSPDYVAEHGAAYVYIVDGMYNLFHTDEFPLTVRVGNYVDASVNGLLGDTLFWNLTNLSHVWMNKQQLAQHLSARQGRRHEIMTRVFGPSRAAQLGEMAIESLRHHIMAVPDDRGFQVLKHIDLRQRQRRFYNIAQLAKLPFVETFHPFSDDEVIDAALQLPLNQLSFARAYRRAMSRYLPELAAVPWTLTLTPVTVSVPAMIAKKAAQLTLGRWLKGTRLGNHPWIRARRYYVDHGAWVRGPIRSFVEETLLSPEANATGLFDPDGLQSLVHDHMVGRIDVRDFLGRALAFALWTRLFYTPGTPARPASLSAASRQVPAS